VTSLQSKLQVVLLATCQALSMTSMNIVMLTSALIGQSIAPSPAFATLAVGLQMSATMAATLPASLMMRRVGRRYGFMFGAALGLVGALISVLAIQRGDFWLFCLGAIVMGINGGFGQFYRFAAADAAEPDFRPTAISLVLSGGVVSGLFGPELAIWSRDLFLPYMFLGCYAGIAVMMVLAVLVLTQLRIPAPSAAETAGPQRPLSEIVRQPVFFVAAGGSMIAYGVMSLVMTATPLAMASCGYDFASAAHVIQWHVLGMFVPSFFTGHLIRRLGVLNIMAAGVVANLACLAINLHGTSTWHFWSALTLLGIGWNFMYVGGSTLVTEAYRPAEKAKVQGLNDFLVFGTAAFGSLSSGALANLFGWDAVNWGVLLPMLLAGSLILWLRARPAARLTREAS
jgi:MFS family permease